MAQVTVQELSMLQALDPAYAAATASGDTFVARETDSKLLLHVKNGDAAAHTVTIDDINSSAPPGAQAFNPDPQFSIPAGGNRLIALDQLHRFRDKDTGVISLTWSAATGMTFAVLRVR